MKVQTLNIATIKQETKLEAENIRIETSRAKFDIIEDHDGSIVIRAYDRTLVVVCQDASSAQVIAAPFDRRWITAISGQAISPDN